jgi:hypothetical protein
MPICIDTGSTGDAIITQAGNIKIKKFMLRMYRSCSFIFQQQGHKKDSAENKKPEIYYA